MALKSSAMLLATILVLAVASACYAKTSLGVVQWVQPLHFGNVHQVLVHVLLDLEEERR
jgi:hypothetical protein